MDEKPTQRQLALEQYVESQGGQLVGTAIFWAIGSWFIPSPIVLSLTGLLFFAGGVIDFAIYINKKYQ